MTSSFASWMSVPTSKVSVMKPAPRLIKAVMSVTPGVLRRTFSCGSTMLASISSGAAARQKFWIETWGCSMVGNSWIGSRATDMRPNSATSATATATDGHCFVLRSVKFIPTPLYCISV